MVDLERRNSLLAILTAAAGGAISAGAPPLAEAAIVSVVDHGAVGDGRADDTEAFRTALERGAYVLVPPAKRYYRITRTLAINRPGQRIVGMGPLSRIKLDLAGRGEGNLFVTQHEDSGFIGLHLTPATQVSSLFEGWSIAIVETRRVLVHDCHISEARRGGVILVDSDDCRISRNVFTAGLVKGDGSEHQAVTGFDILVAGSSSRTLVEDNQCLSGVGTAIGCQTVTPGKSQRGNTISRNMIAGYPGYGIMAYLSAPADRIGELTIEGNSIEDVSGSIRTDEGSTFYGCGIYLQSANDMIVTGNRIIRTNTDRRRPFSGSAVPAAIGISGYGNAVVSGNIIDTCHHGIASIQTTALPRRGDATIISNNLVRNCDGAGVWLADCAAATVEGNRLTAAKGKGTHGIIARRFASKWMDGFQLRGNEVTDFAVGIEVSGDLLPRAEIASNHVRGNQGNGIYSSASVTMIHHNSVEGRFGISISPAALAGLCRDNLIRTAALAIIDDGGSGVRIEDNIVPAGAAFSTGIAQALPPGARPAISAKRWFRKLESSAISAFAGGYEGQRVSVLAEAPFQVRHGAGIHLRSGADVTVERGTILSLTLIGGSWRQAD